MAEEAQRGPGEPTAPDAAGPAAPLAPSTAAPGRLAVRRPVFSLHLLLTLMVLAALLPALLFMMSQARRATEERIATLDRQSRDLTARVGSLAERLLSERIGLLRGLAASQALRRGDFAVFYAEAKAAIDADSDDVVVVVDRSFKMRLSTAVPYGEALPEPRDPATAAQAFATGQIQISRLFSSPFSGRPVLTLVLPVPETDLVLRLRLSPARLSDELARATPPGWITGIADAYGIIIARSEQADRFVGGPISPTFRDKLNSTSEQWQRVETVDGRPVYGNWRKLPHGWTAGAVIAGTDVESIWLAQTRDVTFGAVIALAAGLFFALMTAFGIGRPLSRLADAAAALGKGREPPPFHSQLREINAVDATLRRSAADARLAEQRLRASETLLKSATDHAAVGIAMLDLERRYVFANPAYVRIFNLPVSAAACAGRRIGDLLPALYPERNTPHLDRALAGERVQFEAQLDPADGFGAATAYYDVVYEPACDAAGPVEGVIITLFDITQRKLAELALGQSEERLRLAQDAAHAGSWEWVIADNKNIWSDQIWALYALDKNKWAASYEAWVHSIHPDDRDRVGREVRAAASAGEEFEIQWRVNAGSEAPSRWLLSRGRPIYDAQGAPERYRGIVIDISARVRADLALQESERRIAAILEALPIGVALLDKNGRAIVANPVYRRFVPDQVLLKNHPRRSQWETYGDKGQPIDWEDFPSVRALRGEATWPGYEFLFLGDAHQKRTWTRVAAIPFRTPDGALAGAVHMIIDIDNEKRALQERETMQAELLHLSRLSEMGQMAAALAHELNQPLTAVAMYLGAGKRMLDGDLDEERRAKLKELMQSASGQSLRAGEVIRQMRDFVHKGAGERQTEDAAEVMRDATQLAVTTAKLKGVAVSTSFEAAGRVLVNRVQIEQVVLNLVRNAIEAMETTERKELSIVLAVTERQAQVTVSDTGAGLLPQIVDRLFLPFSSTKAGGMGIGLSVCRNIIEAHGGRIWAEANPGGGTIFRFVLPLAESQSQSARSSAA